VATSSYKTPEKIVQRKGSRITTEELDLRLSAYLTTQIKKEHQDEWIKDNGLEGYDF